LPNYLTLIANSQHKSLQSGEFAGASFAGSRRDYCVLSRIISHPATHNLINQMGFYTLSPILN